MLPRLLALLIMLHGVPALAQSLPDGFDPGPTARVVAVVDGDTVALDDGSQVRLVGIMAPKLSLGRDHVADQPLGEEARLALADLVDGREVTLHFGGVRMDRHGRHLAHLVTADGTWVQGALLGAGLARVYSFADNRTGIAGMLALEEDARAARRGIWAEPFYAVRDAADPGGVHLDSFELIEGVVLNAAEVDRRIFLNFGEDWKRDVTVTISPSDREIFRAAHVNPLALEGQRIRVRGWTGWRNGPSLEIDHPEQIEVLD